MKNKEYLKELNELRHSFLCGYLNRCGKRNIFYYGNNEGLSIELKTHGYVKEDGDVIYYSIYEYNGFYGVCLGAILTRGEVIAKLTDLQAEYELRCNKDEDIKKIEARLRKAVAELTALRKSGHKETIELFRELLKEQGRRK